MLYFDHAATTPTDERVVKKMLPYFEVKFENPSSLYKGGIEAKKAVELSRKTLAKFFNCKSSEIIFTNGGTESDNIAIFGVARNFKKGHIITSQIEHHAVLNSCKQLEREGFKVTYLPVNKDGIVEISALKKALTKDTILVSIMYANNEIGTVQPVAKISEIIRNFRKKLEIRNEKLDFQSPISNLLFPFFHSDACQATQYLEMNVEKLGVDLLTINGSKIYGPKGIGALYVRDEIKLEPILFGGEQESGLRPGTENVPGIVGLAEAIEIVTRCGKLESRKELKLRDYIIRELLKIEGSRLNGSRINRLPNNINISFEGVEGESLVLYLDKEGIYCSTGSACTSKSLAPSHVIMALTNDAEIAHGSLRVTIGRSTTKAQADKLINAVKEYVKKLREMSAVS